MDILPPPPPKNNNNNNNNKQTNKQQQRFLRLFQRDHCMFQTSDRNINPHGVIADGPQLNLMEPSGRDRMWTGSWLPNPATISMMLIKEPFTHIKVAYRKRIVCITMVTKAVWLKWRHKAWRFMWRIHLDLSPHGEYCYVLWPVDTVNSAQASVVESLKFMQSSFHHSFFVKYAENCRSHARSSVW